MRKNTSGHKVDVYASYQEAKITHAIEQQLKTMTHIPLHIHTSSSDWDAQLSEHLCHSSIWGDRHVIVLHVAAKDLKSLKEPWFKLWLERESDHHLIISLHGSYANKIATLQHPNIRLHNLYDQNNTLTSQDREAVNHQSDALMWLEKLKSLQPTQYQQWLDTQASLSLSERIDTLQTYYHKSSSMVFLTWIQVLIKKQPFSTLQDFKTSEIMECFNMTSAFVRSGLLDEETSSPPSSGLMKWPEAKTAWNHWKTRLSRAERYAWYLAWIEQELTLKGMRHPLNHSQAWQTCIRLSQSWMVTIAARPSPSQYKGR